MSSEDRDPVLVAVDFSPDSRAALFWAATYAETVGAPLVVVHIIHDPADAPGHYQIPEHEVIRPMEDRAREMLDEFLDEMRVERPDLARLQSCRSVLVSGLPPTRILEVAQEVNANHIVVGSRGLTGLDHIFLGSNAQRVIQLSPRPVTVVKAPECSAEGPGALE